MPRCYYVDDESDFYIDIPDDFICPFCEHSIDEHIMDVGDKTERWTFLPCLYIRGPPLSHCHCDYFFDDSNDK